MSGNQAQTIAAISTAMTESGIGIVRMSGSEAVEIADRVYRGKKGKKLENQKSHTIHYGYIADGNDVIDEVLIMLMRGPHSFTGEDRLSRWCVRSKKDIGNFDKIRGKTCRARRIYKESFFEWKDGSFPGRSSN